MVDVKAKDTTIAKILFWILYKEFSIDTCGKYKLIQIQKRWLHQKISDYYEMVRFFITGKHKIEFTKFSMPLFKDNKPFPELFNFPKDDSSTEK